MIPSRQLSQLPQSHKHSSGIYWSMFWAVQENVTHWEVFRFELKKGFCALQTITEKKIIKHFWRTHSFHIISRTLDIRWLCICIFFLLSGLCGDTVFTWEPQGEKLLPHPILIRLETAIFFPSRKPIRTSLINGPQSLCVLLSLQPHYLLLQRKLLYRPLQAPVGLRQRWY